MTIAQAVRQQYTLQLDCRATAFLRRRHLCAELCILPGFEPPLSSEGM